MMRAFDIYIFQITNSSAGAASRAQMAETPLPTLCFANLCGGQQA